MKAADAQGYDVAQRADHVEIRGISRRRVVEALDLLERVRAVQADHATATRDELVHTLMASNVPLTPSATVAQTQRLATHRDALLATPLYTHGSLSELRGDAKESATRTWLSRRKAECKVFTVTHNGRTLIPAFQLDDQGEPRPELQPLLAALQGAGVRGWALWTWLTSPTSLLSGAVPEQLVHTAPKRVLRAAERFAAAPAA
jgi:hypothetical protein